MSQIALNAAPVAPLRLTARGRLVLLALPALVLITLATLVIGAWLSPASATQTHLTGPGTGLEEVTVLQGDSLWSIARDMAPSQDTREVVAKINKLNDVGATLYPGEKLVVPADQ